MITVVCICGVSEGPIDPRWLLLLTVRQVLENSVTMFGCSSVEEKPSSPPHMPALLTLNQQSVIPTVTIVHFLLIRRHPVINATDQLSACEIKDIFNVNIRENIQSTMLSQFVMFPPFVKRDKSQCKRKRRRNRLSTKRKLMFISNS